MESSNFFICVSKALLSTSLIVRLKSSIHASKATSWPLLQSLFYSNPYTKNLLVLETAALSDHILSPAQGIFVAKGFDLLSGSH